MAHAPFPHGVLRPARNATVHARKRRRESAAGTRPARAPAWPSTGSDPARARRRQSMEEDTGASPLHRALGWARLHPAGPPPLPLRWGGPEPVGPFRTARPPPLPTGRRGRGCRCPASESGAGSSHTGARRPPKIIWSSPGDGARPGPAEARPIRPPVCTNAPARPAPATHRPHARDVRGTKVWGRTPARAHAAHAHAAQRTPARAHTAHAHTRSRTRHSRTRHSRTRRLTHT